MPFQIVRNNIVNMSVDALVNAANSRLQMGSGVCGAIFDAAGYEPLSRACAAIGGCPTGSAVITPGFKLPAKYIVHAVGPIWYGGDRGEEAALRGCYRTALELARDNGCSSIAFPLISAGIYGYPKEEARRVAEETIREFLTEHDMTVYLVLFGTP